MRLIDADELKTHKFLTPQVKVIGGRKNGKTREQIIEAYQKGWNDCIDAIIDNAPTADDWQKYSDELWKNAYEKGKEDRPQGEWIEKIETKQFGLGWLTSQEIVCSICGGSGEDDENIPQCWKFCPNCGAKMQKSE